MPKPKGGLEEARRGLDPMMQRMTTARILRVSEQKEWPTRLVLSMSKMRAKRIEEVEKQ
jgi:hypothetical protein